MAVIVVGNLSSMMLLNDDCPLTDAAPPSDAPTPEATPDDSTDDPTGNSASIMAACNAKVVARTCVVATIITLSVVIVTAKSSSTGAAVIHAVAGLSV